jgi:hypothetical protein
MALIKTTKRSHGPTIYVLEITESEALDVLQALEPDHAIHQGLAQLLPPGVVAGIADALAEDCPDDAVDEGN